MTDWPECSICGYDMDLEESTYICRHCGNVKEVIKIPKTDICNECGHSVKPGSGRFVNRIPDLDDVETRREMGKPFPEGDFMCAECEDEYYTNIKK